MYLLSLLVPVRMRSRYRAHRCTEGCAPDSHLANDQWAPETATWWQWRGHIWAHRVRAA